ncbi:MAG: ribonuclease H-like domain-containing protein [Patescibacteria group bacterium]|nr:ribonuclease H-like domain-containing protein [Patescibacteria group bacterium]
MLRNTFVHLPGVGSVRERTLWTQGILDWDCFLAASGDGRLPKKLRESAAPLVRQSVEAAAGGDVRFFGGLLPSRETWRLYPEFAGQVLFLDIETTGLSPHYDRVTTIGALGGGKLALFIDGINLEQFPAYVAQFPLLVTFNGSQFDVPFLRTHFPKARLDQAHIDLRFTLSSLGYRGGLKAIERSLGLRRDRTIQDVDGFEAVRLWHCWRRGDRASLRKLALYNLTDVVNMVELVEIAVRHKTRLAAHPSQQAHSDPPAAWRFDPKSIATWLDEHLEAG